MRNQMLLAGLFGLCLTLGCGTTSQQWVKDYVSKETVSTKTEFRERLQPLEQGLMDNKAQVEALRKDVTGADAKLGALQGKSDDVSKSLSDISQGYKAEVTGVRQDVEKEIKGLQKEVDDIKEKFGRLGPVVLNLQKGIDLLSKRLEIQAAQQPPAPAPSAAPKK